MKLHHSLLRAHKRPRLAAAVTVLALAAGTTSALLLPASPGYSADYQYAGTLTRADKIDTRQVTAEKGTFTAKLTFTGPAEMTASLTLRDSSGKVVASGSGRNPLSLTKAVSAGTYRLDVETAWPLTHRDLPYKLSVTTTPSNITPPTTPPPTTAPPTTPPPTPPTTPPTTDSNADASCGTWVLYQVANVSQLRTLRPKIENALKLPGVVGFSVRFPWDAADLTGTQTTNALLDEAYDITSKAGKALSIRFMAGAHTPTRVFDAGAGYISVNGDKAPLPWDDATGKVQVFLNEYAAYAGKLATWSRAHDVRLLHLSWFGLDWAELNHGAEVRAASGYTKAKWMAGHKALIDVGAKLASKDLAVELPLSGYGPLSGGESDELAAHIVTTVGANNDQFFIQANGWDETRQWGAPDMTVEAQFDRIWNRPLLRGVQMIQPDGYDWAKVFDQAEVADATYTEVYLPSFWQTPGPTAQYNHNTPERIAQLEKEIAAFAQATC